jgi:hypothetical protein
MSGGTNRLYGPTGAKALNRLLTFFERSSHAASRSRGSNASSAWRVAARSRSIRRAASSPAHPGTIRPLSRSTEPSRQKSSASRHPSPHNSLRGAAAATLTSISSTPAAPAITNREHTFAQVRRCIATPSRTHGSVRQLVQVALGHWILSEKGRTRGLARIANPVEGAGKE